LHNLDTITSYASKAQKNALSGQIDIFGSLGIEDNLPGLKLDLPSSTTTAREMLSWERELLGLYLSSHPLDDYAGYLSDHTVPLGALTADMEGKSATVGGIITTVRKITTKNNAVMAFVGLEDKSGSLELIVFPKAYEQTPQLWQPDHVIQAKGKINTKDREGRVGGDIKVMVDSAQMIDYDTAKSYTSVGKRKVKIPESAAGAKPVRTKADVLVIRLESLSDTAILTKIKDTLVAQAGSSQAYIVMPGNPPKKILLPFEVEITDDLINHLSEVVQGGKVARIQA
jgi:DNA polymerase-3 subunit alpha